MATGRDISEQKRAEARLRETKERLEVAASAGIVGVWDWDIPNDRMLWDRVMYHLYGITGERGFVARAVWSGALHPADKAHAEAEIEAALRREREFAPVFRIVWPDGSIHHIKAASRTTFDASGRPLRMVGVSYDIAAQKNIEERLQQGIAEATRELEKARDAAQAASEAKSAFLANMSHELRTPLNGIIGLAYILQKTELTPRQKDHLAKLLTSSQHLLALLNDILNYVRINTELHHVEHQAFRLQTLVGQIVGKVRDKAAARGLQLVVDIAPELPDCLDGDADLIGQVLMKLADNAVKFTESGRVQLGVRLIERRDERVVLQFDVCDTGIGIAEEAQAQIFQRFHQADASLTRRYGGTGLGLAIARRLVELMGGEIGVDSEEGQGSRFWFTVAVAVAQDLPGGRPAQRPSGAADQGLSSRDQGLPEARPTAATTANAPGLNALVAEPAPHGDPPPDRAVLAALCNELLQLLDHDDLAARQVLNAHADLLQSVFQDALPSIEAAVDRFDFPSARAALVQVMARSGLAHTVSTLPRLTRPWPPAPE